MKKILTVFIAMFMFCAAAMAEKCEKEQFRVSADAEVRIKPNRVAITFGVYEKTDNLKQGKDKMKKIIGDALAFCKKSGVKAQYLQTENIYITPRYSTKYEYDKSSKKLEKEILEYDLQQTFTVTLEDPSKYDTILYSLLDMGVNRVENVNFYSTEMRKYRDQARLDAIKHAQEKANLLTSAVGIKLGKIVNINEDSFSNIYFGGRRASGLSNVSQNMIQNYDAGSSQDSDLAAGMISVKASVSLVYDINK